MTISSTNGSDTCLYVEYFHQIDSARIAYGSEDKGRAVLHYKKAFSRTSFPLSEDLTAALRLAAALNDSTFLQNISIILAKGGIPLEYFREFSGQSWYPEFVSSYDTFHKYYSTHFDTEARIRLLELRKIDSTYNEKYHSWRRGEIELSLEELTYHAKQVGESFKAYVDEFGFPSEQNMGYYYRDRTIKPYPISVLLIHLFQRGELLFVDQFEKLYCNGLMTLRTILHVQQFRGYGNSTGVEQEMKIRYKRFRPVQQKK